MLDEASIKHVEIEHGLNFYTVKTPRIGKPLVRTEVPTFIMGWGSGGNRGEHGKFDSSQSFSKGINKLAKTWGKNEYKKSIRS